MTKTLPDTNTFEEYVETVYKTTYNCTMTSIYLAIIWETPQLFHYIDELENYIENSE